MGQILSYKKGSNGSADSCYKLPFLFIQKKLLKTYYDPVYHTRSADALIPNFIQYKGRFRLITD